MVQEAVTFATERHKHQTLNDKPYIAHPLLVYEIIQSAKADDETAQIAALLHDTVEDTAETILEKAVLLTEIEKQFGTKVAELVRELTDKAPERKQMGKVAYDTKRCLEMPSDALTVRLADRLAQAHNIFGFDREKTFDNLSTTKQVLDAVLRERVLDKTQMRLLCKFVIAYHKTCAKPPFKSVDSAREKW